MVKKQLLRKMHPTRRLEAITVLIRTGKSCNKKVTTTFLVWRLLYKPIPYIINPHL